MDTAIKQFIETQGSELTLNCENTDLFEIFLKNNITIYLSNIVNAKAITIQFLQDSTGSRTVSFSNQFTFPDVSTVASTANGYTVMKFNVYEGRCVCTFNSNASAGGTEIFDTITATTGNFTALDSTNTRTSQTTENDNITSTLTTDSTFITGTNITYSSSRGSAIMKLTGVWSAITGAFSNICSFITSSGNQNVDGAGVIGIKQVVTNTGACTDGNIYGAQFIAKHNHATNKMTNEAPLIGVEGWSYNAGAAPAGTMIGGNFGYHNEGTTAKDPGAVYRGIQIFCDDAAGSTAPSEASGLTVWNQAGTQTNAINVVKTDGGFTNDITLQNGETISNATDGKVLVSGVLSATTSVAYVVKTIKKTIGGIGITADFNFVTAANTNEQVINLGAIIPAKARIADIFTFTDAVFTGATTLVAETGITSSGAELIGSATIYATNAITYTPNAGAFVLAPSASASSIYVSATPGANWSGVTAGKVSVYVTYIDVTNI
jgi:hypothetical protein